MLPLCCCCCCFATGLAGGHAAPNARLQQVVGGGWRVTRGGWAATASRQRFQQRSRNAGGLESPANAALRPRKRAAATFWGARQAQSKGTDLGPFTRRCDGDNTPCASVSAPKVRRSAEAPLQRSAIEKEGEGGDWQSVGQLPGTGDRTSNHCALCGAPRSSCCGPPWQPFSCHFLCSKALSTGS